MSFTVWGRKGRSTRRSENQDGGTTHSRRRRSFVRHTAMMIASRCVSQIGKIRSHASSTLLGNSNLALFTHSRTHFFAQISTKPPTCIHFFLYLQHISGGPARCDDEKIPLVKISSSSFLYRTVLLRYCCSADVGTFSPDRKIPDFLHRKFALSLSRSRRALNNSRMTSRI